MMSAKNKTFLFIGVIFVIFSVILIGALNVHQNETLRQAEREFYLSMQTSYEKVVERQREFYFHRIIANIHSPGILDAVAHKDREKLYELSKGRWKTLHKENPNLIVMHFHLADGRSLLRMHDPLRYGDLIADEREMVRKMHHERAPLFGYEVGKAGVAFRIFEPMFQGERYIGALEFGLKPDQVLQDMLYYHNLKGALFVKMADSASFMEGYTLQTDTLQEKGLIRHLKNIGYSFPAMQEITYQGKSYNVYAFDLSDFKGQQLAKALFFQDITQIKESFHRTLLEASVFIGGLVLAIMLFVELGFRGIITALDKTNNRLQENQEFLDSILHASDHAIIATDTNGTITLFNSGAEKLLGYSENEVVNQKTPAIFHDPKEIEERAKKLSEQFNKTILPNFSVFTEKTLQGVENNDLWTYITKTGDKKTVHLHLTSIADQQGNISGFLAVAEDVTDQIRLQYDLAQQKEELETILSTSKDGIAILDLTSKFLYANPAYLNMTGFTLEELLMKSCVELSIPEDVPRAAKAIAEVLEKGFVENFEKTCRVKDGEKVTINMAIALMPDHQRLLISTKNVTEAKEIERAMQGYVKLIDENIITSSTDLEGNITYASEAFCKISGYTKEELLGQNHRIVHHPDMQEEIFREIWETITHDRMWEGEIKNQTKSGGFYWVYSRIYPIYKPSGEKYGYTAIRQDITDKKKIEDIAIRDGLTGIYNRRFFNEMFSKFVHSAQRSGEMIGFILMDVDHFKQYNDTYGHQMGDDVLIRIAQALAEKLQRSDDYCFRLGGEEFGILVKLKSADKGIIFAESIRESIESLGIEHRHNSAAPVVTVSMGLVIFEECEVGKCDGIYRHADELLYKAKEEGRNRVCMEKN